ncbi:hypothetical protein [Planomonospora parontospora]|uniref:hypothetical protein n=1 Tax=Planomonospora parontospora TaxID=58119 RepID=UPI001670BB1C|nr:hypothetical protein [Planomonospora parontospora]GGL57445.1 hypothetical protein GCM10014719_68600 [Planomonospora parontospora subsp. antibiotica]GII19997.1 hypothetical protein Ppa05_67230 [Planomonospora parontospora subsp. antibiotica]
MNTPAKLGAYALGLAVVFGGALGIGNAVGAVASPPAAQPHTVHEAPSATPRRPAAAAPASLPGGLQMSESGYTLTPQTTTVPPGEATDFRFTVTGPDGRPLTGYQTQHGKQLHLIVVSRDLGDFRHLHPAKAADGTWSVKLTLPEAGVYRAFADFAPEGGHGLTLGTDLHAAGDYTPRALPEVSRTATVDGYTVELGGELVPGASSALTLTVSKDGKPVTDLQPYLGAYGHLVALRAGDLAYLHVHPDGEPGDGTTAAGPGITFHAEVPSRGDYRLFLDFQHEGVVRTAAFTAHAGQSPAPTATPARPADTAPTPRPAATPEKSGSHGEHTH